METGAASVQPQRRRGISRREVLGVAVAGGIGVAAARLLAGNLPGARSSTGKTDWISPLYSESARVTHLLRRATFGATPGELERSLSDGYAKTVQRLIETPGVNPPSLPGGDAANRVAPLKLQAMQKWWVDWLLATPTPLTESMTFFWHGHFTSDYRKVGLQYPWLFWQNLTWRQHSLGDFKSFLLAATTDPGMLRYLDLNVSTGRSPNENYARELMELFTMGPGHFTEEDVRSGAKALAGWREPRTQAMMMAEKNDPRLTPAQQAKVNPNFDSVKTGVFDPKRAYSGPPLKFLGKTGRFDTEAVIDAILAQSATAPFVVKRLLTHFAMPNPADAYVSRLATSFRSSKYDLKHLMRDILLSDEFNSAPAYRSLVKSPTEFMVHALKAVQAPHLSNLALQSAGGQGQVLFDPPDVGGWPINESWISSNTVVARVNFVTALLNGLKSLPAAQEAPAMHLDGVVSGATANLVNSAKDDRERWFVVLASPEFQLK